MAEKRGWRPYVMGFLAFRPTSPDAGQQAKGGRPAPVETRAPLPTAFRPYRGASLAVAPLINGGDRMGSAPRGEKA